jgi:hypothetical protein
MNWEEKHAQQLPSIHSESRHLFIKLFFVFFIGLVFGGCGCILSLAMCEPLWIFNGAALISTSFLSAILGLCAGCSLRIGFFPLRSGRIYRTGQPLLFWSILLFLFCIFTLLIWVAYRLSIELLGYA